MKVFDYRENFKGTKTQAKQIILRNEKGFEILINVNHEGNFEIVGMLGESINISPIASNKIILKEDRRED